MVPVPEVPLSDGEIDFMEEEAMEVRGREFGDPARGLYEKCRQAEADVVALVAEVRRLRAALEGYREAGSN